MKKQIIIESGDDIKKYRAKWGLTYDRLAWLMGYGARQTIMRHEKSGQMPPRAKVAYTLLFDKLEANKDIANLVCNTKLEILKQVQYGIEQGRLPEGIDYKSLPSYKSVTEIMNVLKEWLSQR